MSEAHTTLGDDEQRARYMKLLSEGSGSPEMQDAVAKVIEAAQNFQKAEVYFKRNDLAQAEVYCRHAHEPDATQPDYLAMLAWLLASKPENQSPEKALECIKMLDRAASMGEGRCEKAYFWRGMLYKRIGKVDQAAKDFRRAVDLNPRNIDAAREVRLHNMRGGRSSTPPPPRRQPDAGRSPRTRRRGASSAASSRSRDPRGHRDRRRRRRPIDQVAELLAHLLRCRPDRRGELRELARVVEVVRLEAEHVRVRNPVPVARRRRPSGRACGRSAGS